RGTHDPDAQFGKMLGEGQLFVGGLDAADLRPQGGELHAVASSASSAGVGFAAGVDGIAPNASVIGGAAGASAGGLADGVFLPAAPFSPCREEADLACSAVLRSSRAGCSNVSRTCLVGSSTMLRSSLWKPLLILRTSPYTRPTLRSVSGSFSGPSRTSA